MEVMLKESPDKLIINGNSYSWQKGITFFVFNTISGKTRIAFSEGSGTDFHLQVDDVDLTPYISKQYPEYKTYLDHENLIFAINQVKLLIDPKSTREDFIFSGRAWRVGNVNYISIWNNKQTLEFNKKYLNRLMAYLKMTYENTLFELPTNQKDYKPYIEIDLEINDKFEKELRKTIHTMDPRLKRFVKKSGMFESESIKKSLTEDPDLIRIPTDYNNSVMRVYYDDNDVNSVFSIFGTKNFGTCYILGKHLGGHKYVFKTNNRKLDKLIDVKQMSSDLNGMPLIHSNLLSNLCDKDLFDFDCQDVDRDDLRELVKISGRTFKVSNDVDIGKNLYVSFWNTMKECKNNWEYIDIIIKEELHEDVNNVYFEFIDSPFDYLTGNGWISYHEFLKKSKIKSKLTPEQIKMLIKIQHTNPDVKKILKIIGSNQKYLDVMKKTALKMGITVAELKNMLVFSD